MIFKDEEVKSFMKALEEAKFQPYTEEERKATDEKIAETLEWLSKVRTVSVSTNEYGFEARNIDKFLVKKDGGDLYVKE